MLTLLLALAAVCQSAAAISTFEKPIQHCASLPAQGCAADCDSCTAHGLQCLPCGCQGVCLPKGASPQTPHMLCTDKSIALGCEQAEALAACKAGQYGSGKCTAYKCGNTCSAVCSAAADSTPEHFSDEAPQTTRRSMLHVPPSVKEGDIICPDRVTPARICVDIPPLAKKCDTTTCATDSVCKMVSCPSSDGESTQCIPVCVKKDFEPTPGKCPTDYPEVQCSAPGVCNLDCMRGKRCISNTCGNCTALCVDAPDDGPVCVDGPPVNCIKDPCMGQMCPRGTVCKAEYCGGCNFACVLRKPCSTGKPRRPCLKTANRCMVTKCAGGYTCVPDQCNNCAGVCVPPCPPGQYVSKDTAKCTECPKGKYCVGGNKDLGTPEPKPCNGGFYADETGLSECKKCYAGTTTPAKPRNKGYTACVPDN